MPASKQGGIEGGAARWDRKRSVDSKINPGQTSTVDLGAGSGAANATISFNTTDIRSITFTYGSSTMFADPTYQHIGTYNIDYAVVPEPSALGACLIVVNLAVFRSHRWSKAGS